MGLFSFLRKNKQGSASAQGEFFPRAEEELKTVRGRGKRKQGSEPVDPVLPEKKRARRRLVGALALVLAVIIGLPMILDSDPKPLADDIAIQIPSKDKSPAVTPTTRQVPASGPSNVAAMSALDQKEEIVDAPPSSSKQEGAASSLPTTAIVGGAVTGAATVGLLNNKVKDDVKPTDAAKPAGADKANAEKPATVATAVAHNQSEPKPELKPEPKPVSKPESKSAAQTLDKHDEAARATAILEGRSTAPTNKPTEKKSGKFVVQVAALATQEKINEVQGKLKVAGIKSYTQKVATVSGERTRIRVGPFASKEEADKMRTKLIKLGLNGTLMPSS